MLRVEGRREGRICYVWLRIIHWRFYGRTSYKEAVTLKIFFVKVQHKVSAVSLPVLLPWFLCSIHSFTFECPKAAALLVRSLWSRGMLCWVWHAIISLTCTYFSSGISNVSRASFSLVAGPHKNLFQDKRRFLKLFPWMVGLRGTGRDGKGKNLVFRHTNKMIASLFFLIFFTSFWQLWLLETLLEAACILLSDWCENQKNPSRCAPWKSSHWWHACFACPLTYCKADFHCFPYSSVDD